jgi:hypothetical protein
MPMSVCLLRSRHGAVVRTSVCAINITAEAGEKHKQQDTRLFAAASCHYGVTLPYTEIIRHFVVPLRRSISLSFRNPSTNTFVNTTLTFLLTFFDSVKLVRISFLYYTNVRFYPTRSSNLNCNTHTHTHTHTHMRLNIACSWYVATKQPTDN